MHDIMFLFIPLHLDSSFVRSSMDFAYIESMSCRIGLMSQS